MNWEGVVTTQGLVLMEKFLLGSRLILDDARAGTGTVDLSELREQTALVDARQTPSVVAKFVKDEGAEIMVQFTAATERYCVNQIGLYAHLEDEESVLMAIYQDEEGVVIPSGEELPEFVYTFGAVIEMDNPGGLEVVINPKAFLTMDMLEEILAAAKTNAFHINATIPAKGWPGSAPYTLSVSCQGVQATDTPFIACSGDSNDTSLQMAWGRVTSITAGTDKITVHASNPPTMEIPIRIYILRGPMGEKTQWSGNAFLMNSGGIISMEDIQGVAGVASGGTGATTADGARKNLGAAAENHVHNTSDITGGVLSLSRGGLSNTEGKAQGFVNARKLSVDLGSNSPANFDGTADASIGVSGTLGVGHGGTGAKTAEEALKKLGIVWGEALPGTIENGKIYLVMEAAN